MTTSPESFQPGLKRQYLLLAVIWSALVMGSAGWNIYQVKQQTLETATTTARANNRKDISFRKWATMHGGVYVPRTAHTPPSPYLNAPDQSAATGAGKVLTLMDPAYMLRQMQESFPDDYGNRSHITSLKLLNPKNAPDAFETTALHAFERGEKERLEIQTLDGQPYLRLMQPFIIEPGCLQCHAHQGYKAGDINGGVSTAILLTPLLALERRHVATQTLSHSAIWLAGIMALGFSYRRQRRDDAAHKANEEQLRLAASVFDNSSEGIAITAVDQRILRVNRAFSEITGYSETEALGQTPAILKSDRHDPDFYAAMWASINATGRWRGEIWNRHKNGELLPEFLSINAVKGANGQVTHYVAVFTDIRESKRNEEMLKSLNDTLMERVGIEVEKNMTQERMLIQQSRLAAMGELVHNISHHWRQPLNTLVLILANLKDAYEDHELTGEYLDKAVANGQRVVQGMSATIDNFRNFFRPNTEKKNFRVGDAVADAIALVSDSFMDSRVEIVRESDAMPGMTFGYPNEFAQVFVSILTNAKEAILGQGRGGTIHIKAKMDAKTVTLSIRDNGGGVPEAVLGKVFNPYFTTRDRGTGIGLYMSRMILEKMDSSVEIRNVEGGAEVLITLLRVVDP